MRDKPVAVTGGCLCGAIRYEAEVFAQSAYICHCTLCQKSTGQPFEIGVPVKAGTFRWIKGEPTYYAPTPWGRRGFCPTCRSRLVWFPTDPANDWMTNIDPCVLDDPSIVRPAEHVFVDTCVSWLRVDDTLPRYREDEMAALGERRRIERTAEE